MQSNPRERALVRAGSVAVKAAVENPDDKAMFIDAEPGAAGAQIPAGENFRRA